MQLNKIITLLIPMAAGVLLASCDNHPRIEGTWTGTPIHITNIDIASEATATFSVSFTKGDSSDGGQVTISALIDANQPVSSDSASIDQDYEVSVAATAAISGQWSFEKDDDDDILIFLDSSTLQVNVDPSGVTFSTDVLTDSQQPLIDSLSRNSTSDWTKSITKALTQRFSGLTKISDIKIRNGIMSCEIHDRDYTFRCVSE